MAAAEGHEAVVALLIEQDAQMNLQNQVRICSEGHVIISRDATMCFRGHCPKRPTLWSVKWNGFEYDGDVCYGVEWIQRAYACVPVQSGVCGKEVAKTWCWGWIAEYCKPIFPAISALVPCVNVFCWLHCRLDGPRWFLLLRTIMYPWWPCCYSTMRKWTGKTMWVLQHVVFSLSFLY